MWQILKWSAAVPTLAPAMGNDWICCVAAIPVSSDEMRKCWKWIEPRDRHHTDYVLWAFSLKDCWRRVPQKHIEINMVVCLRPPGSDFPIFFFFFHNLKNEKKNWNVWIFGRYLLFLLNFNGRCLPRKLLLHIYTAEWFAEQCSIPNSTKKKSTRFEI